MASLLEMINYELVKVGDTIEFTFKGNTFSAKILRGGLIGSCKQVTIHDNTPVDIFTSHVGFSSLTAWTEACLQDILEEYYTRYSSWKRVNHRESKRSMGDLRDQCKLKDVKRRQEDVVELYKEIFRLQHTITEMNKYIKQLHSGVKMPLKQWTYLHIEPQIKNIPKYKKIKLEIDEQASNNVQNAICNDKSELSKIICQLH